MKALIPIPPAQAEALYDAYEYDAYEYEAQAKAPLPDGFAARVWRDEDLSEDSLDSLPRGLNVLSGAPSRRLAHQTAPG